MAHGVDEPASRKRVKLFDNLCSSKSEDMAGAERTQHENKYDRQMRCVTISKLKSVRIFDGGAGCFRFELTSRRMHDRYYVYRCYSDLPMQQFFFGPIPICVVYV